jgi:hypothetical protein
MFVPWLESTREELLSGLYSNVRLLALLENIRLEWKSVVVANTLAYYDTATNAALKIILFQAPGA